MLLQQMPYSLQRACSCRVNFDGVHCDRAVDVVVNLDMCAFSLQPSACGCVSVWRAFKHICVVPYLINHGLGFRNLTPVVPPFAVKRSDM